MAVLVCLAVWTGLIGPLRGGRYVRPMNVPRYFHAAVVRIDGRVLVAGGYDKQYSAVSSCEILDPETGRWTMTGSLHHEATTPVLIRAGREIYCIYIDGPNNWSPSKLEKYDAAVGDWVEYAGDAPSLDAAFVGMEDGSILAICYGDKKDQATTECEIFSPSTGQWSPTGAMVEETAFLSAIQLGSGEILAVGQSWRWSGKSHAPSCCLYNPKTGQWRRTTAKSEVDSDKVRLIELTNGSVASIGSKWTEIYDPVTETWSKARMFPASMGRYKQAVLLRDGRLLVVGDTGGCEIYDPAVDVWSTVGPVPAKLRWSCAVALDDGRVLLSGGEETGGLAGLLKRDENSSRDCLLFHPERGTWDRKLK